jgi:hypothetical protein
MAKANNDDRSREHLARTKEPEAKQKNIKCFWLDLMENLYVS